MKLWFPLAFTALFGLGAMLVVSGQSLSVPPSHTAQVPQASAALDLPWTAVRAGRETTGSIR